MHLTRDRARSLFSRPLVRYIPPVLLILALLAVWQGYTWLTGIPDYLLPSPLGIVQTTLDERQLLLQNAVPTLEIAVLGFLMALALGLVTAFAIHYSRTLELSLY